MMYKEHMVGGIACAIGVCYVKNKYGVPIPINDISFFIATGIGSLLPDIDHPESLLGSEMDFIGGLIKHRTITHSISFAVIMGLIVFCFSAAAGIGVTVGILSHLLLDMIDVKGNGICLLAPFSFRKIGGRIKNKRP